ncbi:hypothetical protein AMJ86_10205, partial [bacterium SM23_57]
TASQATLPDTVYGWGIINALGAANWVIASVPERRDAPSSLSFRLSCPYPNPFNSAVQFNLYTEITRPVSISVYDVLGRKVEQIFEGQMEAGHHPILWMPNRAASGYYWIEARTYGERRVVPVVFLR